MIKQGVELLVGVTGHRDLVPSEVDQLRGRVADFFKMLQRGYPGLKIRLLTSLARGADTLVADVALELGVAVTNVLPMPQEYYLSDFDDASKNDLIRLCEANETFVVPYTDQDIAEWHAGRREGRYEKIGRFLASHSHVLLALCLPRRY